jgi:hypothetical protein
LVQVFLYFRKFLFEPGALFRHPSFRPDCFSVFALFLLPVCFLFVCTKPTKGPR